MDCSPTQAEEKRRLEFLDGVLQGSDDEVLHGANNFWSTCEDFLFDAETSGKVHNLDYGPYEASCLESFGLGGQSPTFNREDRSVEISGLTTTSVAHLKSTCAKNLPLLENLTVHELHEAFKNSFGNETSVTDKQQLKHHSSLGLGNLSDLENSSILLECCAISNKIDGETVILSSNESSRRPSGLFTDMSSSKLLSRGDQDVKSGRLAGCNSLNNFCSDVIKVENEISGPEGGNGVLATEKRLRKPPQRYIEESLAQNSRLRKCGTSYKASKDKLVHVRLGKRHCQKGFSTTHSFHQEESFAGSCIQVPFGLPVEKMGRKKKSLFLGYEPRNQKDSRFSNEKSVMETLCTASQDDRSDDDECSTRINMEMVRTRRKHHKPWTLSEVMNLIEGVAQYGVGRWTEIKRLLFSSSAHRTSVDLKDKWRNLLKASCMKLQTKRQVEQGRKHTSHQTPQAVLRRVRELALMHPYPRERKSKASCSSPVSSPVPPTSGRNMVPLSAAVRV